MCGIRRADSRQSNLRSGTCGLADRDRTSRDSAWQARTALRLQRRVLPANSVQLLADEVVRRLATRAHPEELAGDRREHVRVQAFCEALLAPDADAALNLIRQQRHDGVSLEVVYRGTLAAACRHLGEMWEDDRVSFLQLSVAAGRIYEIMRWLRRQIPQPDAKDALQHHALFATVPGEANPIGLAVSADLFRNRGWEIELRTGLDHDALIAGLEGRHYRVICLSAGDAQLIVPLTRLVVALRITHPEARIVVCGPVVTAVPGLNALIRADAVVPDGEDPITVFERLSQEG